MMDGVTIKVSEDTKYLEVVLDKKLCWNPQIQRVKQRATAALMACRGLVGQRWGLKPAMMRWICHFRTWQKTEQAKDSTALQKGQTLAYLLTTGAMKSAPSVALEAMLDLSPLPDMVKKEAAQTAFRMLKDYKPNILGTSRDI
jgi:hypothetical protein